MRYLFALFLFVCPLSAVGAEDKDKRRIDFLKGFQGTEWKKDCYLKGRHYFVTKAAFFDEYVSINSWKWYKDPSCQVQLGEFWEKWQVIMIGDSDLGPDVFRIKYALLDGSEVQCNASWDIVTRKGDKVFSGDFYVDTAEELSCYEMPTEFHKSPFILSGSVDMTAEEYIRGLKRVLPPPLQ